MALRLRQTDFTRVALSSLVMSKKLRKKIIYRACAASEHGGRVRLMLHPPSLLRDSHHPIYSTNSHGSHTHATSVHPMGKIGDQRHNYAAVFQPRAYSSMDRYLHRPASAASSTQEVALDPPELQELETGTLFDTPHTPAQGSSPPLTAAILDAKLQSLLQALTHNIAQEEGKLAKELRGKIVK